MRTLSALVSASLLLQPLAPAFAQTVPMDAAAAGSAHLPAGLATPSVSLSLPSGGLEGSLSLSPMLPAQGLTSLQPSAGAPLAPSASSLSLSPSAALAASQHAAALPVSGASAAPGASLTAQQQPIAGSLQQLSAQSAAKTEPTTGSTLRAPQNGYADGSRKFDGAGNRASMDDNPPVNPSFEPPTSDFSPQWESSEDETGSLGENRKRPVLNFPISERDNLLSPNPATAVNKVIKRIRPLTKKDENGRSYNPSAKYWAAYKKGVEIDVESQGENVFGKPVKVTESFEKPLGELTREDLAGVVSAYRLKAGVRAVREWLRKKLDKTREIYNPNDGVVTMKTPVRLIAFESYVDQYRKTNGEGAAHAPAAKPERTPLSIKAEGPLEPLGFLLPRVVYVDADMLETALSKEVLTDMSKLQRVNTVFVFFSRKPYGAEGGIEQKIIKPMSFYHQVMLASRVLAVTDNGAVVNAFGKNANLITADVAKFSDSEMDVLRDATHKAAERAGIPMNQVRELPQPPLVTPKNDFPDAPSRPQAPGKPAKVRYQVSFVKDAPDAAVSAWLKAFNAQLRAHLLSATVEAGPDKDGHTVVSVQKTDIHGAMDRVKDVMGQRFNLFINDSDPVLLSQNTGLAQANPKALDVGAVTGLKGAELLENAVGLMLGDHRYDLPGDIKGSASKISGFMHHKDRFRQDMLIREDEQGSVFAFAGHVIHGNNDWLVWNRQNGRTPTFEQYAARFEEQWEEGIRQRDPITLPNTAKIETMKATFLRKSQSMYKLINKIADRGEILVATEVPNFFFLRDYKRRTQEARGRYLLRTVFDFVALRPVPGKPGHATLVIYDFKTGRAETREMTKKRKYKKSQHMQMLLYAYFAQQKWVGREFPAPYLNGDKKYVIDDVKTELIFNNVMLPIDIDHGDLGDLPSLVIRTMNRINKEEQEIMSLDKGKKTTPAPAATKEPRKKTSRKKIAVSAEDTAAFLSGLKAGDQVMIENRQAGQTSQEGPFAVSQATKNQLFVDNGLREPTVFNRGDGGWVDNGASLVSMYLTPVAAKK